jgi:Ca2+-binding EF-hand superfamily protein
MGEVSISRLVNSIVNDYDRNGNGVIDLKANGRDESYFDKREVRETPNETVITDTRYSYDALFLRADADKDNKVTKDEITAVANEFDKDKNGKLTVRSFWDWISGKPEGELDVFSRQIPERSRIIYQQTIPHAQGPAYPVGDFPEPDRFKNLV